MAEFSFFFIRIFLKIKHTLCLEECTSFLLDWLIEGRGGLLQTNP